MKDAREEEIAEVIRPMIGHNQPVGSQGASKMVAEVLEVRLGGRREEVLAEEPLDGPRWWVVRMVRQVEEAALFVLPPFFVKRGPLKVSESGGEVHSEVSGCIATIGETKKECRTCSFLVPPVSRQAKDVTYHSNDKSAQDTRRVSRMRRDV